ncbi:FG-GAP-like repeat-containing protein [Streptomyces monticola]|uniref:FG-GAP-like repeat-containing protein n=1 Tax=Streptomyces monticola TaxID=2666263 RepID=A0ABW2JMF2_9ACTN
MSLRGTKRTRRAKGGGDGTARGTTGHAYKPLSLKRRAWLTVGAVVLGGTGAVTYAMAGTGEQAADDLTRTKRPAEVHDIALKPDGSGEAGERELPRTGTEPFSLLGVSWQGPRTTIDGSAQVRTRAAGTGTWSDWQPLGLDPHISEDVEPGMRGASEPLWVGPSDGVEVRVVAADGSSTSGLPKGLEVNLVDPGVTAKEAKNPALTGQDLAPAAYTADSAVTAYAADETVPPVEPTGDESSGPTDEPSEPGTPGPTAPTGAPDPTDTPDPTATPGPTGTESPTASPDPTPTKPPAPPSTVKRPPITGRAAWGADESKVKDPAEYIERIQAVFVHHTVGGNNYSCAESAALVRGIMTYHVDVEGWNDLGYNFLVDKCGQIFEGRGGGADLPVKGAHTYGYNKYSTGIAFLGDFEGYVDPVDSSKNRPAGKPTRAALEAASRVAAWKLGQYGGNPGGTVTLQQILTKPDGTEYNGVLKDFNVISGHKDGFNTACPGKNLYPKLAEIRRYAASAGRNSALPTADFNRDGIPDLVAGTPQASGGVGALTVVPGGVDGPVATAKKTLTQSSPGVPGASESGDNWGASNAWGDINGDGYADLVVGAPGEDDTSGHKDRGAVTVLYGPALNTGTSFTTDEGDYATGAKFGSAVAAGDFNADGKADVFTASTGTGGTWFARTGDSSGMGGDLTTGSGALAYADAASGDFNRDGYADVALNYRDQSGTGRVVWFKGTRTGLTKVGALSVKGGRSIAAGDFNGNGYDDIAVGQPYTAESGAHAGGQITMVPGTSTGFTTTGLRTIHQATSGVPGAAESGDAMGWSVAAGDVNGDGYADVLAGAPHEDITRDGTARKDAGTSLLVPGSSTGLTGAGTLAVSQDEAGVPGATESGDRLGSAVVLNDLSGYGRADLAIGVDGEDAGNGTILQLDSGSKGVSLSGAVYYGVTQLGTPAGARLGQTLAP